MGETPLNVPEILANVLQYVDSKTLVAAAQVNSMWANEATNWIWRGGYRISFDSLSTPLQRLSDCSQERRDWYTRKIRCLDLEIDYDESNPLSIPLLLKQRQFAFANARSVIVDLGSENMDEKDMVQFLSPSLLCLELYGGYYTRWFLEQVKIRSPLLQLWLVDNRLVEEEESSDALTTDDFLDFLTSMKSIKHIELNLGWEPILDEKVMRHIMLRSNLEVLNLGYYLPLDWRIIKQVQDEYPSDHIFPVLRYLEINAEEKALRLLLSTLRSVQGVSITQINIALSLHHILGTLSSCARLEEITFDSERITSVSKEGLLNLASGCPLLRRLELGGSCRSDNITDELIETLTSKWKHLEVFCVSFSGKLTIKSLVYFARHCPHIYELELMADLELMDLVDEPEAHFPCLSEFGLGYITTSPLESVQSVTSLREQIIKLLDDRFPELYSFSFNLAADNTHCANFAHQIRRHLRDTRPENLHKRPLPISQKLTRGLLEPIPGSRYNPLA